MRHGVLRVLRAFVVKRHRSSPPAEPLPDARVTSSQPDLPERLRASLAGHYAVERELGQRLAKGQ
jgi:hypothetical protein